MTEDRAVCRRPGLTQIALTVALTLLVAACGGSDSTPGNQPLAIIVGPANSRPVVAGIADQRLDAGESVAIELDVSDDDAGDTHTVTASASDDGIVEVSVADGLVTVRGLAAGTATVTVTVRDDSGADNAESEPVTFEVAVESDWVEGAFEPAILFKDFCANPRQPDGQSGEPFPDVQGETVDEKNWLRSWSNDTYLWYDEIVDRNPALYESPLEYFDLLKTTATTPSGNPKDRFHFAVPTDLYEAFIESGTTFGYGAHFVWLSDNPPREVVVALTDPGTSADAAGLGRGTRILKVDGVDLVYGSDTDALWAGLYPSEHGEMHEFEIRGLNEAEPRTVTLTAGEVVSDPVQHVSVLETDSGPVGYLLFNDFIASAERELFEAFEELSGRGITDLVLDLRYNPGGYLDIACQLGFMIAGPSAASGRTCEELRFNDKHTEFNPITGEALEPIPFRTTTMGFSVESGRDLPSVNLPRVFVLTGPGTCSASEAVINALRGIDVDVVQIGATTCGKPYGFYPADNCGTTYFTVQFQGLNAKGFGDFGDGFSPADDDQAQGAQLPGCSVADDFDHAFADPAEARLQAALRYRLDGTCAAPAGVGGPHRTVGIDRPSRALSLLRRPGR